MILRKEKDRNTIKDGNEFRVEILGDRNGINNKRKFEK
jgi:hypothetical protein